MYGNLRDLQGHKKKKNHRNNIENKKVKTKREKLKSLKWIQNCKVSSNKR